MICLINIIVVYYLFKVSINIRKLDLKNILMIELNKFVLCIYLIDKF